MLELGFHQGAGLHSFMPQAELRVVAVASQDSAGSGLEALWQVCAILQRLGYPVVVLDGTAQETDASPGLAHLLRQAPWNEGAPLDAGAAASSLAVIPAARGLRLAAERAQARAVPPLQGLLPHFRRYGLMVLHAPASMLGPLLTHTATIPMVVMGSDAAGVLNSYKSLKQIALDTGLPCMVAGLLHGDGAAERHKVRGALQSLQDCAERHGCGPVRTTTIATHNPQELQRLALQLLENAGTISEPLTPPSPTPSLTGTPAYFARSH
ncbi:MAG: hypothetical protein QM569_03175 [Acidovorax sp.]|uniref:hypothetical protein n=1 Tax=Acidovorax sp. TaxID=1872122 RepID=UPI0039E5C2A9